MFIDIEAIALDSILPRAIHLELRTKVQGQFNRISASGIGPTMLPLSALLASDSSMLMIGKDKARLLATFPR